MFVPKKTEKEKEIELQFEAEKADLCCRTLDAVEFDRLAHILNEKIIGAGGNRGQLLASRVAAKTGKVTPA